MSELKRLRAILVEIIACEEDADYGRLCDMDGGAPGETSPYQSNRLRLAIEDARDAVSARSSVG
jgi:hypothetical protein